MPDRADATGAERYAELLARSRVRERALFPAPARLPNELELQARWFAGDFGRSFRSTTGAAVEVVQFGTWNREAGPDFSDAVVRLDDGEPLRGDVEFELIDRSWETHGHAANPAFDETILHVYIDAGERTFFTRTSKHRNVPQVRLDLRALENSLTTNVPLAHAGRCHAPLRGLPNERIDSILAAAAGYRLGKKAARLRRNAEAHGDDDTLFPEVAAALGYKQNKLPFTLLAQRLPLASLRTDPLAAEASLFGVAGFLSAPDLAEYESSARTYVRALWDRWWPERDAVARLILPAKLWKLSGARPLNHPQRRLAALAAVSASWKEFADALRSEEVREVQRYFLGRAHPYWNFHYTLTSPAAPKPMALIGNARIADILANVVLPWWASRGRDVSELLQKLTAPLTNRRVETAATRLFADDERRPRFMKSLAHQQGLLQIYEDFCLQDESDCAQCPFPEQMQKWP